MTTEIRDYHYRICIIDDDAGIVAFLRELFEGEGHLVLTPNGLQEAEEVLLSQRPHVVISDRVMPNTSNMAQDITAIVDRENLHTKVLMMTAAPEVVDRLDGRRVSDAEIAKPFDLDNMYDVAMRLGALAMMLDQNRDTSQPPAEHESFE